MVSKILQTIAGAALVCTTFAAPQARAADFGPVAFTVQYGGWHHGYRRYGPPRYGPPRYGPGWGYSRGCMPEEAIYKASVRGLHRAVISRVTPQVIVVDGFHRGHRATLVFSRDSNWCRVISGYGI